MKKIILSMLLTLIMHFNLPASEEIINKKQDITYFKKAQEINHSKALLGPFFRNPAKETNEIQKKIFQFILITGTVYFIFAPIANNNNILDPNADYITQIFTHCFSTLSSCKTILTKIRERNFVDSLSYLKDYFYKINLKNLTRSSIIYYVVMVIENKEEITNHNDTKKLADEYEKTITSNLQDYQAQRQVQITIKNLYTELQEQYDKQSKQLKNLNCENINLQKKFTILENTYNSLKDQKDILDSEMSELKEQLNTQTREANFAQTKNEELQQTLSTTQENLTHLRTHCDNNDMMIRNLRSQSTTTKLENEKLQRDLILLQAEIKNKNEQLTNKQVFLKKENPTVSQLQDEKIHGLQSQLKILQKEIENLREQLKERPQREIFEIPTELEIEPEETTTLQNENDELKIKIAELQQKMKLIESEILWYKNCTKRNIVFQTFSDQNPNHNQNPNHIKSKPESYKKKSTKIDNIKSCVYSIPNIM